jgi:hypothetical protein
VYRGPDREVGDPADRRRRGGRENLADRWFVEAEIVPQGWTPPADWQPDPLGDAADRLYPRR